MEIDYGLALDFLDDHDSRPYQLRFRRDGWFTDIGQLIAVVAKYEHPDNGHTLAISRPNVTYRATRAALCGWQTWAKITDSVVNLAEIRRRIHDAHLD